MNHEDLSSLIRRYESGPIALQEAVAGLSEEQLGLHPKPGKWSICQLVSHLVDAEIVYIHRLRKVLAEEGGLLTGFDQDAWVNNLYAETLPVNIGLAAIQGLRQFQTFLLRNLDDKALMREGTHETDGVFSAYDLLKKVTDHFMHHVGQIRDMRQQFENGM